MGCPQYDEDRDCITQQYAVTWTDETGTTQTKIVCVALPILYEV